MRHKGSIIALAWPQTPVRRNGIWYDIVMKWFGFIKNDYYRAGHAAAILVNHEDGHLHYFDFGRYHTRAQAGRVRDRDTDPELEINTRAVIDSSGYLTNLKEILCEVSQNKATHGSGRMFASIYSQFDFAKSYSYSKKLQAKGSIRYGPFDLRGTNCCRFVAQLIKKGRPDRLTYLRLSIPLTVSPTTKSNVVIANTNGIYYSVEHGEVMIHQTNLSRLKTILDPASPQNEDVKGIGVQQI